MKISKFATTTLVAAVTTFALMGTAWAGSTDITDTGPSSSNTVTIDNSNHVDVSNDNNVTVNNNNTQTAQTGDASVKENTTGGSATSGPANNSNSVTTTLSIDNQSLGNGQDGCGCLGGQNSNDGGNTSKIGGAGGSKGVGGGGSLSVGSGMLPETGAHSPIDVSALRNLIGHVSNPVVKTARPNPISSVVLLAIAAVMSLIGAIGTAKFSTKRTLKV